MRKIHLYLLIFLIALVGAACGESEPEQPEASETFIQVINNSARQITSIELKLYQNEKVQASPTAMNADESLIVMEDAVEFDILQQDIDFDEPVTIEAVAMINGVEESAGQTEPMELVPGESYQFELSGDEELHFREMTD
ncbi:hypothetical protein [Metaplanococcus flavidus]|uniref:EfeO-type cupredoxin-like domain-containing protein n=1 Tax=Metaplanococcus flavidus TaxID=569883 RepID=A0ABW3LCI2_9BACL